MADLEGGLVICRPQPRRYHPGDDIGWRLMSDLHIGSSDVDYKLISAELQDARDRGDRILVNGDVFDMILPSDNKRFVADCLHSRLVGKVDILNKAIDWAYEIFEPYADLIDMMGIGNHESSVLKRHSTDPTLVLVDKLRGAKRAIKSAKAGHLIHYGGYTGFTDYRFFRSAPERDRLGGSQRFIIYYHHGSGGAAPVTKGMIDFARKQWVSADVIWMGHKHNRWNAHAIEMRCPMSGDEAELHDVRHIMTGSYFNTYHGQTQASLKEHGRRASYASDMGLAPQGKGGARLVLCVTGDSKVVSVTQ